MMDKIEQMTLKLSLSLMAVIFTSMPALAADPVIVNDGEYFESDIVPSKEAYGEVEGLPQLDFSTYTPQIFWMLFFFVMLYIIFAKKTLPDISNTIENRKNHIQSDLETAEKLTAEADQVHDTYQESLVGAQKAASDTVQKMESKMKDKAEKAMNDFRGRSEDEIQNAEERIISAKQAAMADMNQIVTDVTTQAVEKILGQSPDVSAVQNTVETLNGSVKAKAA